ncbi:putative Glucan endo-1,3-beta-glucosidase [Streptomyces afghaniensis 772]|uniref:Putative Glucan endo-1,3-beta-glucosidase n=1 Tax=Streptomyces afghaniensis 772 TaxID=1283301 RepID=S4NMJ1_9ACTN|nr:putative Glucan endo-1,3-beta-glucosidase [Streptomyces afghaniensis 772]
MPEQFLIPFPDSDSEPLSALDRTALRALKSTAPTWSPRSHYRAAAPPPRRRLISTSTDGTNFTQVASGTWAGNQALKVAEWPARNIGFVRHSGKAADVERGGTANRTNVLQWPCLNKANEKWTFSKTGDG